MIQSRYFVFTLTAYQAREGEEQAHYIQLEQKILKSNQDDEIRLKALRNTLISQCVSIQTRKKSLHQRVPLLCQLHPFVPNEFNRLLQMLHGENPEEILSSDVRGLYFYFSNKKIRHKIFHPFYLAARFHNSITLYYNNDDNSSFDLEDVFLKIQKDVELSLLQSQNDDEQMINQKKKNQKNIESKLIMQIIAKKNSNQNDSQKSSKNLEHFRSKVLNYLMPLQSRAINIIDDEEVIPPNFKQINYNEFEYQQAYTRVFPKILNTLFEYQEKKAQYPNYLCSVSYNSSKNEVSDVNQDSIKDKNKFSVKYQSVLMHKYDEKLNNKLAKVQVYSESYHVKSMNNKNNSLVYQEQVQQIPLMNNVSLNTQNISLSNQNQSLNTFNYPLNSQNINNNEGQKVITNGLFMNMCNQETNRKSMTSYTSDTVGLLQNMNHLEGKPNKGRQSGHDDANSQITDDAHAQDDKEINQFTPGDNKMKIRKLNYPSFNYNTQNNNNNVDKQQIQDIKSTSEFKNLEQHIFAQNNNNITSIDQLKQSEARKFANLMSKQDMQIQLPQTLSNYQNVLMPQLTQQQQCSSQIINTKPTQQPLILSQNLHQITQQNINLQPQQQQQQIFQQYSNQNQSQQLISAICDQNNNHVNTNSNNIQQLLMQNQYNQQDQNSYPMNPLNLNNNFYTMGGNQNQQISHNSLSQLQNTVNANQSIQQLTNSNNFVQQQQNLQQNQTSQQMYEHQDLLSLIQNSKFQQQNQHQKQDEQMLLQQLLQQQQLQNNLHFQVNGVKSEQQNQQQIINQIGNQSSNVFMNFSDLSNQQTVLQNHQNLLNLNALALKQQQQQLQQANLLQQQQQFRINNNQSNQFDNQNLAQIYQQMMSQYK